MNQREQAGNDGVEEVRGGVKNDAANRVKTRRARLQDLQSELAVIRRDIAVLQEIVGVRR
jgi:hypothetical protein